MSRLVCAHCTTRFSVGVPHCPLCGNADYYPEGSDMAKITRHGGPSDASVEAEPSDVEVLDDLLEVEPVVEYETWLRTDLQDECGRRGLPTSGNKADLVARLEANDKESAVTEPEETAEETAEVEEAVEADAGAEEPSADEE